MSKQSAVYLDDQLKKEVRILVATHPDKYKNMSDFIRQAVAEKLALERQK